MKANSCLSRLFKIITGFIIFVGIVYFTIDRYVYMPRDKYKHPQISHVRGIDISHFQNTIDWNKLSDAEIAGDKISFVYIKAMEGTKYGHERFFRRNFQEARKHGILRGAYHYWKNTNPELQAKAYIKRVKLRKGDLAPMLDIEDFPKNKSVKRFQKDVLKWLDIVERHYGVRPVIYACRDFIWKYLDSKEFDKYPLWIAHYHVKRPVYFDNWDIWQYTEKGRVSGIKGKVDLNVFKGTYEELLELTIK